jgi:hypothetical protein
MAKKSMNLHLKSSKGRDPHAHPSHHYHNRAEGTPMGLYPHDEAGEGGKGSNGIPNMANNQGRGTSHVGPDHYFGHDEHGVCSD